MVPRQLWRGRQAIARGRRLAARAGDPGRPLVADPLRQFRDARGVQVRCDGRTLAGLSRQRQLRPHGRRLRSPEARHRDGAPGRGVRRADACLPCRARVRGLRRRSPRDRRSVAHRRHTGQRSGGGDRQRPRDACGYRCRRFDRVDRSGRSLALHAHLGQHQPAEGRDPDPAHDRLQPRAGSASAGRHRRLERCDA